MASRPTIGRRKGNPKKTPDGFPLWRHPSGRWCKKVRGRAFYFGKTADDPDGQRALAKWLDQKDDLLAGRTPRATTEGLSLRDLCNRFLSVKQTLVDGGELSPITWSDYHGVCGLLVGFLGSARLVVDLASDDFERLRASVARTRGPVALGCFIQRSRSVFKYAFDAGMIAAPVRFGPGFTRPSPTIIRRARQAKGPRLFAPQELRAIIAAADPQMKAMVLLGICCGYGNSDVGRLPLKALDLSTGWAVFPRPKTAVERKAPLWSEAIAAIQAYLAGRRTPRDPKDAGLLFVTKFGGSWAKSTSDNPISRAFACLMDRLGLRRPGLTFYALRHCVETVGGESRDQPAVDHIMGHTRNDMASVYREGISDERLLAVSERIRSWLFSSEKQG